MEETTEPLNVQEVLQAARTAEAMRAQLQEMAGGDKQSTSGRNLLPSIHAGEGEFTPPLKWSPNKEYYPLPTAPMALSPSGRKSTLDRQRRLAKEKMDRHPSQLSFFDSRSPSPFERHTSPTLLGSKASAQRTNTAPALGHTMPARFVQTHHLYTTAAVTHKEVKRGTQTALEACQGLRNDVTAIGDNTHSAAMKLASLRHRLEIKLEHERALDGQIQELKRRREGESFQLKAETAIQQRLHEPCRRVDEAEVAELVVKLSALKEALKECENWRAFEREEHQKVVESNIDRVMEKRMQLKSTKEQHGVEEKRLRELRDKIDQQRIYHTNFFIMDDPEKQQNAQDRGLGELIQSNVREGVGKPNRKRFVGNNGSLFGDEGAESLLQDMEQLPLMRRLVVLQGLSEKFSAVGKEVLNIQRALAATATTSDSSISLALGGVVDLIKHVFDCDYVAIYRVDDVNGVMWGMAPKEAAVSKVTPLGQGLAGYAALSNSVLKTMDARKHPSFNLEHEDYVPDGGPCCCICLPVNGVGRPEEKQRVHGLIKVMGDLGHPNPGDASLLRWIAREVYQIIHHCQNFSNAVREVNESKSHMRITMELCLQFDQKKIMVLAAQRLAALMDAEMAVVYLLDRASGELVGYTSGKKTQMVRRPLQGLLGAAFNRGGLESWPDVQKQQRFVSHVDQPPGVKVDNMLLATMHSALLVTIGIVQVCNKREKEQPGDEGVSESVFSDSCQTLAARVADDVAVAMENARVLKQMQEKRLGMQDHKAKSSKMDTLRNLTYDLRDSLCCENAKVVLVDEEAKHLMVPDLSSRRYVHYPMGSGIVSTVSSGREVLKMSEDKDWKGPYERVDNTGSYMKSFICAPAVDVQTGKVIAVLLAANKRRSGAFDAVDEKHLERCCQKAALLLHNAELHDSLLRDQYIQSQLANKLGALLLASADRFRFIQAVEELCFEMLQPATLCHLMLVPDAASRDTSSDRTPFFPNYAGSLNAVRKASQEFGVKAIDTKTVVSGMQGDLLRSDEHTGESVLPIHVVAHPLVHPATQQIFGALCFQREAISSFRPTEELLLKIMAGYVSSTYQRMLDRVEMAARAQATKLALEQQNRIINKQNAVETDDEQSQGQLTNRDSQAGDTTGAAAQTADSPLPTLK